MAGLVYAEDDFTGMDPLEAYKTAIMVEGNQRVSQDQASANQGQNLYDLLSILPGPGNVIAGQEAYGSAQDAAAAFGEGRYGAAAGNAGLTGLNAAGAVLGLPVGKYAADAAAGARDSAAVFLPLVKGSNWDKTVKKARDQGATSEDIWNDRGFLVTPEGTVRHEVSDKGMTLKELGEPGTRANLEDVIDHPELFDRMPELRNKAVVFRDAPYDTSRAKTMDKSGDFALNVGHATQTPGTQDVAKLLQYEINKRHKLPQGKGHGTDKYKRQIDDAALRAMMSGSEDAGAYITRLNEERGIMDTLERSGAIWPEIDRMMGLRNAGNVEAYNVQHRAKLHTPIDRYPYTYGRMADEYDSGKLTTNRSAPFRDLLPTPNKDLTDAEMADFLKNWRQYGSGKKEGR